MTTDRSRSSTKIHPRSSVTIDPAMLNRPGELPRLPNCRSTRAGDITKAVKESGSVKYQFPCPSTQKPFIPSLRSGSFLRSIAPRSTNCSTFASASVTRTRMRPVS